MTSIIEKQCPQKLAVTRASRAQRSSSPLLINNDPTKIDPNTNLTPSCFSKPSLQPPSFVDIQSAGYFPMDFSGKNSRTVTPVKDPKPNRSKISEMPKKSENLNPNYTSPDPKLSNSAPSKSAKKSHKSVPKIPNPVASPSPRKKIRERKFVVAKKNSKREKSNSSTAACQCNISGKSQKCLCVAYETLRASQEGFFGNRASIDDYSDRAENGVKGEVEVNLINQNPEILDEYEENLGGNDCLEKYGLDETDAVIREMGNTTMKRRRDKLLEKAMQSVPEPGSGRVLHLVKAFENLLSIPKSKESDEKESEDTKKGMKWALPGLQSEDPETQVSSSSFCPSDFFLTSESLGLNSQVCSSLDSSHGSFTVSSRNSGGGQRSRRNSLESSGTFGGRQWKRRHRKVTSQKPFNLRTEQRGRLKEEEFIKKVQERMIEEKKQRIPVAQGLPWTTDELEVVEKMSFIEQYRRERERQQKLAEEEEIRRLRKELVPRAQPMPYFERPFNPRRSERHPVIPTEPRFHLPQHKEDQELYLLRALAVAENCEMNEIKLTFGARGKSRQLP